MSVHENSNMREVLSYLNSRVQTY